MTLCTCGHPEVLHHHTGKRYTHCAVWDPVECPCPQFTPAGRR